MKFGEVELNEALGGILAHGQRAGDRRFKKGHCLTERDIELLREAGLQSVTVARLEADDMPEDEAAQRLCVALCGPNLRHSAPFTGRCNLFAEHSGLLQINSALIDRINRVHESLTVATLSAFSTVRPRQLVATVKVIPFAAPRHAVERALLLAGDNAGAIVLHRFVPQSLALIQTRLPGTKETMLDKTTRVLTERLARLDMRLIHEERCAHEAGALRDRINTALEHGAELILIAGASAIVDRRDVLPSAIELAGGVVDHFGMPVDPGNLLLLARHAAVPVLGLPGCARSPKYNGLDQVLERLAAGLAVEPDTITSLGVGGLLKEAPDRPQSRLTPVKDEAVADGSDGDGTGSAAPRDSVKAGTGVASAARVAAIVLAAGQSRRMGVQNKLLEPLEGKPMLMHALDALRESAIDRTVVVTGHESERIKKLLGGLDLQVVHNPAYADGLSSSLAAGLASLPDDVDAALVVLADMPRLSAYEIDRLVAAFDPDEGRSICVPTVDGKRGNPVLWGREFFAEMMQIRGDTGARHLIGEHDQLVCEVEMSGIGTLLDVDTPEALAAIRQA